MSAADPRDQVQPQAAVGGVAVHSGHRRDALVSGAPVQIPVIEQSLVAPSLATDEVRAACRLLPHHDGGPGDHGPCNHGLCNHGPAAADGGPPRTQVSVIGSGV